MFLGTSGRQKRQSHFQAASQPDAETRFSWRALPRMTPGLEIALIIVGFGGFGAGRRSGEVRYAIASRINTSGPGRVESGLPMRTKTHFAFRVDIWDETGNSIVEHVAGVDDFEVAEATYRAAVARWPTAPIRLRQGARVVHESGHQR
jgi:hypothetical protein